MPASLPGGDLEYAVLCALWDHGRASAWEVHARVGEPSGLVYTTITKVLDRLYEKRLVERVRKGRAFVYRATATRSRIDKARASTSLRRLLGPEPRPAIATLVAAVEAIDPDLLDELGRAVAARKRLRRDS